MKKKTPPIPARTISQCPCCQSRDLLRLEIDVLCVRCDWTSLEAYVAAGGMDNIIAAHNAHFPRRAEEGRSASQPIPSIQTQALTA